MYVACFFSSYEMYQFPTVQRDEDSGWPASVLLVPWDAILRRESPQLLFMVSTGHRNFERLSLLCWRHWSRRHHSIPNQHTAGVFTTGTCQGTESSFPQKSCNPIKNCASNVRGLQTLTHSYRKWGFWKRKVTIIWRLQQAEVYTQ